MGGVERRTFLKSCVVLGAGVQSGLWMPLPGWTADTAKMSIVRYKEQPVETDGVAEEAERLTRKAIELLGGMSRFISKGDVVWLKPNMGWDRTPEQAANTNPVVIGTLVKMCYEAGAKKVLVSDNPCNPARMTFPRSGIQAAAKAAGAQVAFMDERHYKKMAVNGKVLKEWEIYADVVEADKLINVPVVKHHELCEVSLSMKNLMGSIGGARNRLHQDIHNTLPDLAAFFKPDLVVIDAIRILKQNGPVGGNLVDVVRKDTMAAGTDCVALDAFGTTLLERKPEEIGHIVEAAKRGLGVMDYASLNPVELVI